jgi:large subunit ribosomal protein LP0
MSGGLTKREKKEKYMTRFGQYLNNYSKIMLVGVDNVASSHFQEIRQSLRGKAVIVMGKNTIMRKVIRTAMKKNEDLEDLLPHIKGNIGCVFTNGDLNEIRGLIQLNKKPAPARVGTIAPIDVILPPGPTGMEPTMTSFLQALNIASKINKGQVEIVQEVHLISKGEKVGNSEASLLQKLNIQPFWFGLQLRIVYDNGTVYSEAILDLTDSDILNKFKAGVQRIACIGLAVGYPTVASLPHSIINAYKNVLALSLATDYTIKATEKMKQYLENPDAFVVAAPVAAASAASTAAAPAAAAAAPAAAAEPAEESDDDMGFGLFD